MIKYQMPIICQSELHRRHTNNFFGFVLGVLQLALQFFDLGVKSPNLLVLVSDLSCLESQPSLISFDQLIKNFVESALDLVKVLLGLLITGSGSLGIPRNIAEILEIITLGGGILKMH